jgi:hypothetical protein
MCNKELRGIVTLCIQESPMNPVTKPNLVYKQYNKRDNIYTNFMLCSVLAGKG